MPWNFCDVDSILNASITISWVALKKATNTTPIANNERFCLGSVKATNTNEMIIRIWDIINQVFLCPNFLNRGIWYLSINGAQIYLKAYAKPAQLNKVTVLLLTPAFTSHTDKVEKINRIGKPEENPNNKYSLIMGADNLQNFHKWKNYRHILENYSLYVYPRNGYKINRIHANIHFIKDVPQIEISASFIRESIKQGKDVSYLMPEKAWKYTDEMNLYR